MPTFSQPQNAARPWGDPPQTIGVQIASHGRPQILLRCLDGLKTQSRPADDVIVIVRETDEETRAALAGYPPGALPLRVLRIASPGVVAARNAGLDACLTDVLAIVDDDTRAHPDWLHRIMQHFIADPFLGGLGGRDRCFDGTAFDDRQAQVVGRIQWFGRVIGNHHLGCGDVREVDVLKGANMSFRSRAFANVRFDLRLKGHGTQPNEDKCFSVAVKCRGWKLAYDPLAAVDHFPAPRAEVRQYVGVSSFTDGRAYQEFAYNEVLSIWDSLSAVRRVVYFAWSTLIGTGTFPGLVQAFRYTPRLGRFAWLRFWLAQKGKVEAFRDLLFA